MELLSDEEALAWMRDAGLRANGGWHLGRAGGESACDWVFRVQVPEDATAIAGLAYTIAITGAPDHDEAKFQGALLWLRQWEIWSESIDRTGYALLDGVRRLSGQSDPLDAAPAQSFGAGEFFPCCASLCLPMMFQWDARFIGAEARCAVVISHEGFIEFVTWAEEPYLELLTRFQPWKPNRVRG